MNVPKGHSVIPYWTDRAGVRRGAVQEEATAMRSLIIINEAPYGTERCYNALRVAHALLKQQGGEVDVFLMADAVTAARRGQKPPEGYYNIELMLKRVARAHGRVMLCGTCMDARGLGAEEMLEGAATSNMMELSQSIAGADKVLVF
jgi:uncharacterized protein involved in oxidation of intracellular sulfur